MTTFKASILCAAIALAPGVALAQTTEAGQPESPAVSRHQHVERTTPPRARGTNREPGMTTGAAGAYDPTMDPRWRRDLPPGVAGDGQTEAGSLAGSH